MAEVRLEVMLGDGFADEEVVVELGGEEVYRAPRVRTRTQISQADRFQLSWNRGPARLTVSVPGRALTQSVDLALERDTFLRVDADPSLDIAVGDRPFPAY